jgi:hypothetical protein
MTCISFTVADERKETRTRHEMRNVKVLVQNEQKVVTQEMGNLNATYHFYPPVTVQWNYNTGMIVVYPCLITETIL